MERRDIAIVRSRDHADPSSELLLDPRKKVFGRGEPADKDDRVDLGRRHFGELVLEEGEDLVGWEGFSVREEMRGKFRTDR